MRPAAALAAVLGTVAVSATGYILSPGPRPQPEQLQQAPAAQPPADKPPPAGPHQLGGGGPGNLPKWGPGPATLTGTVTITSGSCPEVNGKTFTMPYNPLAAMPTVNGQPNPGYIPVVGGQAYAWGSADLACFGPGPGNIFLVGAYYDGRFDRTWTPHMATFPVGFRLDVNGRTFAGPPLVLTCPGQWTDGRTGRSGAFVLTIRE